METKETLKTILRRICLLCQEVSDYLTQQRLDGPNRYGMSILQKDLSEA